MAPVRKENGTTSGTGSNSPAPLPEPVPDPELDVEAYIRGMHNVMTDLLGDAPEVRLAVLEIEVGHTTNGMLFHYGVDGVLIATKRMRNSIDVAERNALMSNEPM